MDLRNTYYVVYIYVQCFLLLYSYLSETVRNPRYMHKLVNHEIRELHCRRLLRQCDSHRNSYFKDAKKPRKINNIQTLKNIYINDFMGNEGKESKTGMLYTNQFVTPWIYKNFKQIHSPTYKFIKKFTTYLVIHQSYE